MQLVLDTHNIALRQRNRSFYVTAGKERRMISPHKVSSIAVISPCTLTSAAVLLAVEHRIPIIFFDHSGEPEAQVWSTRFGNLAELRRAQVLFALDEQAAVWATEIFRVKAAGQLENLAWIQDKVTSEKTIKSIRQATESIGDRVKKLDSLPGGDHSFHALINAEAIMAKLYWSAWGAAAPPGFTFAARSRRPAQDIYNAALNYLYGMLYNAVESAVLAAGMDPMFGIIHADEFGAPTLVFDLIEPFRPLADRLLMQMLYENKLDARHFEPYQGGIGASREGRKILIGAFNDWLQQPALFRGQKHTLKNHLYLFAGELASQLKQFWEHDPLGKLRHRKRPSSIAGGE